MIKFLDLHKINKRFITDFQNAFNQSLEGSHFILGNNVSKFENEFANYCGTKHCVGTASGLDALTLILKGYIQLGRLQKGDKVIVPANTFIATILSVLHAELEPVLVEPDLQTYNLCIDSVKANMSNKVKAIIMVHLYGQIANVESFQQLAKILNILLIEDAAQAHGAEVNLKFKVQRSTFQESDSNLNSLKVGNLSDAAAFSFYPSKNLGALGDGGAITTNDSKLFEVLKLLRNYGSKQKYKNEIIGYNSRLDDLQAAFLSIKLKALDTDNEKRRIIARRYLNEIITPKLKLPLYNGSNNHVFYVFVIEVENRGHFTEYLDTHKIEWLIHYPIPPNKQKALKRFSHLKLPLTENIHKHIISIPISPVMTNTEIEIMIKVLNNY